MRAGASRAKSAARPCRAAAMTTVLTIVVALAPVAAMAVRVVRAQCEACVHGYRLPPGRLDVTGSGTVFAIPLPR